MKKKLFGFIKGIIAVVLLLLVAAVLFSVVSFLGVITGIFGICLFVVMIPGFLYEGVKFKKK